MQGETLIARSSKTALWIGRGLSGLGILFLIFDGLGKMLKLTPVMEACAPLEIPESVISGLGIVLILSTLLYAIPQTAILGAIVLTGYLGGAVWTHVRMAGGPVFPMVFPVLMGAILWGGLYLREPRLRALVPLRRRPWRLVVHPASRLRPGTAAMPGRRRG